MLAKHFFSLFLDFDLPSCFVHNRHHPSRQWSWINVMIFISILTHKFDNLCGLFCDLEFLMTGKKTWRTFFLLLRWIWARLKTQLDQLSLSLSCFPYASSNLRGKSLTYSKWVKSVESPQPLKFSFGFIISKTCQLRRNLCCHGLKHWKLWVCFSIHFVC